MKTQIIFKKRYESFVLMKYLKEIRVDAIFFYLNFQTKEPTNKEA